ncbi:MAG: hydrolase [Gammaproteobacteria bacterium]|nr:hydrolase [Gammaproteobacteria bacterium]
MLKRSDFKPAWWLSNRHLQTIVPNILRPQPDLAIRRERIELPDGDFVDADWVAGGRVDAPIVILLHGLEGSIKSRYAGWMLKKLSDAGYRAVIMHSRSCSGEINRLPQSYHSGQTRDFEFFFKLLKEREPDAPLAAIGYSLSGNAILKWLADNPQQDLLVTGVAVSVPFDLKACSEFINRGFSKVYQAHLMLKMKKTARAKRHLFEQEGLEPDIASLRTFRQFDNALTAPLHGFADADDYYARCSSRPLVRHIGTPTLIIHAKDDPFMSPATPPTDDMLADAVTLELAEGGGHVGFVGGRWPWQPRYYLEERIPAYLREHLPL